MSSNCLTDVSVLEAEKSHFLLNPHRFHLSIYINITKPMTVAADGLCKKVFAFGVVNMARLAGNGDFCHLTLILLQMPVRVHGHTFSLLADAKAEAIASPALPSFALFLIHTLTFSFHSRKYSVASILFPHAVLVQGRAQILKSGMRPDF